MWSVGTTLFELYTSKICFPGKNNNGMLKSIMDMRGKFPHKLIRKGMCKDKHFDLECNFLSQEFDKFTERVKTVTMGHINVTRDLSQELMCEKNLNDALKKKILQFKDIKEKIFTLDHSKRIIPSEALMHPFIREDGVNS